MANYDQRVPLDYKFSTLSAAASSTVTTLSSSGFTNFPSDLSTTKYVPITIADDSLGVVETVWVTGHAASSTTVTVIRGREGTSGRAWSTGATWRLAPTVRDALPALTRATLPGDAHLGMRALLTDESGTVEKTATGWADSAPFGGAPRRAVWRQTNNLASGDTRVLVSGLAADAGNYGVPSFGSGNLVLNKAGVWSLMWQCVSDYTGVNGGYGYLALVWSGGPWPADLADQRHRGSTAYNGDGILIQTVSWTGYVTAAQAAQPIKPYVQQVNPNAQTLSFTMYLVIEYLGA